MSLLNRRYGIVCALLLVLAPGLIYATLAVRYHLQDSAGHVAAKLELRPVDAPAR